MCPLSDMSRLYFTEMEKLCLITFSGFGVVLIPLNDLLKHFLTRQRVVSHFIYRLSKCQHNTDDVRPIMEPYKTVVLSFCGSRFKNMEGNN